MFRENGIIIDKKIIRDLFRNADVDGNGSVSLNEFKRLMTN